MSGLVNTNDTIEASIKKADILIEALPYIRKLNKKRIVIKYGGNAMVNEDLKKSVMDDITLLKSTYESMFGHVRELVDLFNRKFTYK